MSYQPTQVGHQFTQMMAITLVFFGGLQSLRADEGNAQTVTAKQPSIQEYVDFDNGYAYHFIVHASDYFNVQMVPKKDLSLLDPSGLKSTYDPKENVWYQDNRPACYQVRSIGPDSIPAYWQPANPSQGVNCVRKAVVLTNHAYGFEITSGCGEGSEAVFLQVLNSFRVFTPTKSVTAKCPSGSQDVSTDDLPGLDGSLDNKINTDGSK
jgi:hypothetical protein